MQATTSNNQRTFDSTGLPTEAIESPTTELFRANSRERHLLSGLRDDCQVPANTRWGCKAVIEEIGACSLNDSLAGSSLLGLPADVHSLAAYDTGMFDVIHKYP
jgi:hypothetical protein